MALSKAETMARLAVGKDLRLVREEESEREREREAEIGREEREELRGR